MKKKSIIVAILVLFSGFSLVFSFPEKETPLMNAASKGNIETIKKLIAKNANVNAVAWRNQPHGGKPVLRYAIDSGSVKAVKLLIQAGANVNEFTENPIILPERKQANERNLFLLASAINSYASVDIVKELINGNADVNKGALIGDWTPLMIASYKGHFGAVKELLKAKADKTLKNYNDGGRLAIDYAREQGHMDIVYMLEGTS